MLVVTNGKKKVAMLFIKFEKLKKPYSALCSEAEWEAKPPIPQLPSVTAVSLDSPHEFFKFTISYDPRPTRLGV